MRLRSQFVLVVAAALLVSNGVVFWLVETSREGDIRGIRTASLVDRIAASMDLIASLPPRQRGQAMKAMTTPLLTYAVMESAPWDEPMDAEEQQFAAQLRAGETNATLGAAIVRMTHFSPPRQAPSVGPDTLDIERIVEIAQPLGGGGWIVVRAQRTPPTELPVEIMYGIAGAIFLTSLAAAWLAGRVSRPLTRLATAADEVARGKGAPHLAVSGPSDIRRAAEAFNAMSDRVTQTLESQRQLLSAVGHDLRTPIAAMRITAEFVQDPEVRDRLSRNLEELQSMTEAVLSAVRSGPGEEMRRVDLAALVESLGDDLVDLGQPVEVAVEGPAPCLCRPNDIRRALRNLIENAVRYGDGARVSMLADNGTFSVIVEDDGPGIPPDRLEHVFEPFVRLEGSRSADTGGAGLGLTLARAIAREHGGDVVLENRKPVGLRAILRLPKEK